MWALQRKIPGKNLKKKQPKNCLFFQQGWQTELWGFGDNQLQHMELQLAASSLWWSFLLLLYLMCSITIYGHRTDVSTASSSSHSLLAAQLAKMCKRVLVKHGRWTLYVCWHQDISCGAPCEAAPRFHPHFCYIPEIVDWIGIWGVLRPGMSIWALCHVSQMLFVIRWGKLPSQAGIVWLR